MDSPGPGSLGGTYAGNPISCAAALAALDQVEKLKLAERARDIEEVIREELAEAVASERVAEIRGRGGMIALEIVDADGRPDPKTTAAVATACKHAGVAILTCGMDGNVIRLLPPLVIDEALLRDGLQILNKNIVEAD